MSNPAAVASPQKRARAGAAAEEETVAEMLGVACKGMKSKYENWENIMSTTVDTVTDFAGLVRLIPRTNSSTPSRHSSPRQRWTRS